MSAINRDTLATYGAPFQNYGTGPVDPTTDQDASAGNKFMSAISGMTMTRFQTAISFTWGGSAVAINWHWELWGNVPGLAIPVAARTSPGTFTVTYPTNVADEITIGNPGYTGPQPTNLIGGIGQVAWFALPAWSVGVTIVTPNVLTVTTASIANGGGVAIADPTNLAVVVWGF